MRRERARSLLPQLAADRFGFEPEITARLARANARIYEVPISYAGRTYAEGKKINWKDGFHALQAIIRYNIVDAKTNKLIAESPLPLPAAVNSKAMVASPDPSASQTGGQSNPDRPKLRRTTVDSNA